MSTVNAKSKDIKKKRSYRRKKKAVEKQDVNYRELCITRFIEKCNLSKKRAVQEEAGIYNYAIDVADRLILPKKFTNRKFRDIYFNKQRRGRKNYCRL